MQSCFGMVKDISFALSRWYFSFKYLKSSQELPALFLQKPMEESRKNCLVNFNTVMVVFCWGLPIVGQIFICISKFAGP